MDSTEDKSQEKTMAENKRTSENKSRTDSTDTEKSEKTRSKKRSEPSSDNQDQVHKLIHNGQWNKIVKKEHLQLSSSDDIKLRKHTPKDMKIKLPETTRDDKSFLSMSASHE